MTRCVTRSRSSQWAWLFRLWPLGLQVLAAPAAPQTIGMVADNATESVTVFNADSDTVLGSVAIGSGPAIGDCSITQDQTLGFITDFAYGVWVIDLAGLPVLAGGINPIPISNAGEDTSLSPNGQFLLVCDGANIEPVSVVDVASRTETSTFALAGECNAVEACGDGSVLTATFSDSSVRRLILDGFGNLADSGDPPLSVADPINVLCAPGSASGAVLDYSSNEVRSFVLPPLAGIDTRVLPGPGISGQIHPSGDRLYVLSLGGIDAFSYDSTNGAIGGAPLFSIPISDNTPFFGMDQMAVHPDGSKLYVSQPGAVEVYDAISGALLAAITDPGIVNPAGVCFPSALIGGIDLEVTRTESIDPAVAGSGPGNLTYAVTVTNNGPADASGVVVSETLTLPAGVDIAAIMASSGTVIGTNWVLGALANGATETLTLVLTAGSSTLPGTDVICGTATATADETDTDPANDQATECTSVAREVDLALAVSESVDPVAAGTLFQVVTVTNNGPSDASGVELGEVLSLPPGVSVDSITPSAGTFTGSTWTLGDLASGGHATLAIALTVDCSTDAGAVINNTATVTAVAETDVDPANDSATESTAVAAAFTTIDFDGLDAGIVVTDQFQEATFSSDPGVEIVTVAVTPDLGSSPPNIICTELGFDSCVSSVVVDFTAPVHCLTLLGVGIKVSGEVAQVEVFEDGVLGATEPVLGQGDGLTPVEVDLTEYRSVTGIRISPSNDPGGNGWDDFRFHSLSNPATLDLAVTATESIDPVVAGSGPGNLTHVVTVTNAGLSDALGVELSDVQTLPAGVTIDNIVPSAGIFAGTTWNLGVLPSGASETLTVTLTAANSTLAGAGVICNTASVTAVDQTDVDPANDSITECTSVARQVDLSVTQSESADPVVAGSGAGNLTYTATVTNNGPSDASGVALSEMLTLPAGVTVDSYVTSAGTFAGSTWALGSLPSGVSETLTVLLTVGGSTLPGTDVVCNTASVSAVNEIDVNPANDSSTECTSVGAPSTLDLAVTTTESVDPATAGSGPGNLTYVVTVTNSGPADASGVALSNVLTLPAGVTVDSITPSAGIFAGSTWTLGALLSSASETLTIVLTVGGSALPGADVICNTASVSAVNEPDVNPANDSSTECTSVGTASTLDLAVTATESVDPATAGSGPGNLTYVVTVTNSGPADASGVALSNVLTLPAGVTVDSITPSAGIFAGSTWTLGALLSSASETLTIVLTVGGSALPGADVICNTASVSAVNEPDVNPANDSSTECTSVGTASTVDLVVTTTESNDPAVVGSGPGGLIYVVTVTNSGPASAFGVALSNILTLPAGVTVDSITPSAGSFAGSTWTLGALPSSTSETLSIVLTVGGSALPGTDVVCNAASVSAVNEPDVNPANDSSTECTSVALLVDLAVTTIESDEPVVAGSGPGNLTHVATVTNNGPVDASGVELTDVLTLPAGVTVDSITPSAGIFAGSTWTLGALPSSASETLTIVFTVDGSALPGGNVICNTAAVSALNELDLIPANDSARECTAVTTLTGGELFGDGFESGDTTSWSSTTTP